jgi:glycosyltransferase A (GT-A) superfamily protein (DUF2064 family)
LYPGIFHHFHPFSNIHPPTPNPQLHVFHSTPNPGPRFPRLAPAARLLGAAAVHEAAEEAALLTRVDAVHLRVDVFLLISIHWIGLRENLQETMVFTIKYRVFL